MQYKNGKGPTRWKFLRGLVRALREHVTEVDLADDSAFQSVGAGFNSPQSLHFVGKKTIYDMNGERIAEYLEWKTMN